MHGLCLAPRTSAARLWPGQLQRGGPAAQGRVVRRGEIEPEQSDDGADQALGLAQRQPKHGPEGQGCEDGELRIPGLSTAGRARLSGPGCNGLVGEPDRQAPTLALELAKQLGNVSQACKMMGYSR